MIYLDNSATTRQYPEVTREMLRYMDEFYGNPSSLYQLGVDSEKAVKKARTALQKAIGMEDGRVYFTSGGTEADNMAIFGAARALKRRGRRIVTTAVEHPAVLECCKELEKQGFEVIYVGVDRNCRLDIDALRSAVNDETILVSMMHVNNEAGTIMPVNEVKQIMKEKDAPGIFHCDAVQSFGKLQLCSDADVISVSGHKIHGPKGTGAICIREGVNIPAFICGGGQESGKRSGTENVPAIAGFGLAAEMSEHGRRENSASMAQMRQRLISQLTASLDDIVINSPETAGENAGECCSSLLNISFLGTRGEVLLHTLEQDGIYVSTGSACSSNKKGQSHVLKAMGLKDKEIEGTLRFSFGRMNSIEEIDIAADKVAAAVKRFRRLGSFR
ncbi:Cysteine desulfurase [uncultured Eubacterium sp.]|uniref:cysteine desulfurase family protein n=1 Tax=Brotomerdimonas butyrica TaxID=2981721 RepID=UPI000822A183|nr:cysteine desulfurase family protein [Brotomerdimonas butyrica]MCU6756130.1 cysteine desulfurase [Brotomerdimonas butyrica]SCH67311.1 Cysteine desulfurase [uncultured Eubacterium sp.]